MESNILKNILVYRDLLLPYSETFIPAQIDALSKYQGFYAGTLKSAEGNNLINQERQINLTDFAEYSTLSRLIFKLFGYINSDWLKAIAQVQPALIHAHFGSDGLWSLPIAKYFNIPIIVTFHHINDAILTEKSLNLPSLSFRLYLKRRQQLLRETNLCIAVSQFVCTNLLNMGCPADKIIVHYIGVDTNKFQPIFDIQRHPIVLFVARLVEVKGCKYLIKAMQIVQSAMPDAELVIIGDGHLRTELEHLAKQSLQKYHFLGAQTPEVVRNWMRRSQVFCVPSITESSGLAEAFGMVFAEAQAMGLPVVSYRTGGIPEVVAHEETGLLAQEGNIEELAAHIIKILSDASLWQYFSERGIDRVNSQFNLFKQTRKLEKFYDELIAVNR